MPNPRHRNQPAPRDKWEAHHRLSGPHALQTHPSRSWQRSRQLGAENRGALNGGVWVVKDRKTGKKYIEKCAQPALVADGTVLQEITILKYLSSPSHAHITRMVDHFVDRPRCTASIYLERCSAGGLEALIASRHQAGELFNEMDVWEWFIQLFSALTYCHYGPDPKARFARTRPEDWEDSWDMVFHRDIKVENILVHEAVPQGMTTRYTLKLADFGCAVARRHIWVDTGNERKQTSWATRGWTPPEAPRFVGRSDVWQLAAVVGCICNLMNMPFFDHGAPAPGHSTALNNAIAESMKKDFRKRPKADEVLEHVRGKYRVKEKELEKDPRPVPNTVDNERRDRQLKRGHEKLQAEIKKIKEAAAAPAINPQAQGAGQFGGAGNGGFGGAGWGRPGGSRRNMVVPPGGWRGGPGNMQPFGGMAPGGYGSSGSLYAYTQFSGPSTGGYGGAYGGSYGGSFGGTYGGSFGGTYGTGGNGRYATHIGGNGGYW
ncbi:kinase-like protein [Karstenula rhodostoma CBS 690.94]|uniref:non-specific serine/threonine protein kinase n=1 Tax=Karstenula rhodostoma CBS 690.94 TaxID=1392251 RepID=A0A9P4PG28_9PLEO|nr:kinase-like protein [Karstenula rhodostoma CBS 690.94]